MPYREGRLRLAIFIALMLGASSARAQLPPIKYDGPDVQYGLGYVAVLSTHKTDKDALKVFADLQQKYPEQLQDGIPAVLRADLSSNGSAPPQWHLIVGPPSSQELISAMCERLRSAGFVGC